MTMGMERWDFLFSVMSSPIVYFLTILLAVCPNINPTMLCAHVCDVNYAVCYFDEGRAHQMREPPSSLFPRFEQLFVKSVNLGKFMRMRGKSLLCFTRAGR